MTMKYPRRYLRTRQQLLLQNVVAALILQPVLMVRLLNQRLGVSIAFGGVALAALSLTFQGWRFLTKQELRHPEPTPEMNFVFMLVAIYPLALCVFLLILLTEM